MKNDFQALDQQAGNKKGQAKLVRKAFIFTPEQIADNGNDQGLLAEIGAELKKSVTDRVAVLGEKR